ncbi:hypothetical protein VTK73DRAFT_7728 [Phialemonium thermophilum]|uniref:Peroxisomal membrane protein PEX16 n=1 Tax=Phialemonium thermophilum TaxID=223376 RepID=A0ABR3WD56_9PEZI
MAGASRSLPTRPWSVHDVVALPPKWLHMYGEFISKNASQVSQIESALRSLTYVIPGRFRDAEIASESIHSGVQLLSMYHDTLLARAVSLSKLPLSAVARIPSPHSRYTRFWTERNPLYRRVAYLLQIVQYVELLCEMVAKRRGERARWRVVVLLEAVKAACRLLLLRITRSRPVVSPPLPEREPVPEPAAEDDEEEAKQALAELMGEEDREEETAAAEDQHTNGAAKGGGLPPQNGHANGAIANGKAKASMRRPPSPASSHGHEWQMPRTGMSLPPLPAATDISSYLLSRVLTADDIKPATRLLNQLRDPSAVAAEVLHILAPLVYALALAQSLGAGLGSSPDKAAAARRRSSWYPWLLGISLELAARQLRDNKGLRTTALEREEWSRRGRALWWWAMRGPAYETVVKPLVGGVKKRVPNLVAGILEDYEYLWENYYFSTSS